jgi:hypothetical protein
MHQQCRAGVPCMTPMTLQHAAQPAHKSYTAHVLGCPAYHDACCPDVRVMPSQPSTTQKTLPTECTP